jgi:diacylglycerol kinase (ATP)
MYQQRFSLRKRFESFRHAFHGLVIFFRKEHNSRIHLFAAVCVVSAGILFKISPFEWLAIILSIGLVFVAEIINTAVENIGDYISPAYNEKIRVIKDLAAAAVLISAITALISGLIIFIPEIIKLIKSG